MCILKDILCQRAKLAVTDRSDVELCVTSHVLHVNITQRY